MLRSIDYFGYTQFETFAKVGLVAVVIVCFVVIAGAQILGSLVGFIRAALYESLNNYRGGCCVPVSA